MIIFTIACYFEFTFKTIILCSTLGVCLINLTDRQTFKADSQQKLLATAFRESAKLKKYIRKIPILSIDQLTTSHFIEPLKFSACFKTRGKENKRSPDLFMQNNDLRNCKRTK